MACKHKFIFLDINFEMNEGWSRDIFTHKIMCELCLLVKEKKIKAKTIEEHHNLMILYNKK